MRKFLIILMLFFTICTPAMASKIPSDVQSFIESTFPKTNFRFDGVIILQDATIYLPLFPAKPVEVEKIEIKSTIPSGRTLAQKPEIVILNNDYVLLKVINDKSGKKTVLAPNPAPYEISSGLLPQDMLVPRGLIIPENLKGIIGNLDIEMAESPGLKIKTNQPKTGNNKVNPAPQLKEKTFYVATGYSKNIQVINSENKAPAYALKQNNIPNDMKAFNDEFLLVTSFDSTVMRVISLEDEDIIKQVQFDTYPEQIIIDKDKNIAYISSSEGSSIYVFNLETMTLSKQIKINGMCEKLTLSDDGTKIFYFDKKTNEIWAIELDNNYLLKDIGKFPNVSKIAFSNNKLYIISRTKSHLAIIDYETNGVIGETKVCEKPVDMVAYENNLYILGAVDNVVEVFSTETDELTETIYLNTKGFSTNINKIGDTEFAIISDTKAPIYCVLDMKNKQVVKASAIDVPIRTIVVTNRVKKLNK